MENIFKRLYVLLEIYTLIQLKRKLYYRQLLHNWTGTKICEFFPFVLLLVLGLKRLIYCIKAHLIVRKKKKTKQKILPLRQHSGIQDLSTYQKSVTYWTLLMSHFLTYEMYWRMGFRLESSELMIPDCNNVILVGDVERSRNTDCAFLLITTLGGTAGVRLSKIVRFLRTTTIKKRKNF